MVQDDYEEFPSFWPDPHARKWNLWGYVDVRDVAAACRLALEAPAEAVAGSPSFIIAAADTVMNRSSSALLAEVFPGVPLTREVGGVRHAARDRPRPAGDRLRAPALLARSRARVLSRPDGHGRSAAEAVPPRRPEGRAHRRCRRADRRTGSARLLGRRAEPPYRRDRGRALPALRQSGRAPRRRRRPRAA